MVPRRPTSSNDSPMAEWLDALQAYGCNPRREGDGWRASCPTNSHENDNKRDSTLTLQEAPDGRIQVHCFAGCKFEFIRDTLGKNGFSESHTKRQIELPPLGACEATHIRPRPAPEVILFGTDRERRHISGYRIRRRRSPKPAPAVLFQGFGNDNDDEGLFVKPVSKPPTIPVLKVPPEGLATSGLVDAGVVRGATGVKRARVKKYSRGAQRRLREAVLSIGHELLPRRCGRRKGKPHFFRPASFITLTYREGYVPHIDTCYAHLAAFWRRLKRVPGWENAYGVEIREYQENGSLHFHLLVHWGVNRWTKPFSEVQKWLSETWADIVAKAMGPDESHLRAGTNIGPVLTDKMLEVYVSKGGVQKLQPGAGMATELSKRVQKSVEAGLAAVDAEPDAAEQERLLDEAEGHHWWGYLDRPRFKALARVVLAEVAPEVAHKLERATDESWLSYYEKKGIEVERWKVPKYAMGHISDRIIDETGVRDALMNARWVDELTGEVYEVPTVPALLVRTVGGGSVQGPPSPGRTGLRLCADCGQNRGELKAGLCIWCEPGLLPPGSGRKSPVRNAKPRREASPSLFRPDVFR